MYVVCVLLTMYAYYCLSMPIFAYVCLFCLCMPIFAYMCMFIIACACLLLPMHVYIGIAYACLYWDCLCMFILGLPPRIHTCPRESE